MINTYDCTNNVLLTKICQISGPERERGEFKYLYGDGRCGWDDTK